MTKPSYPESDLPLWLLISLPPLHFPQDSDDGKTYFLKIHAPWEVLATYADVLKVKVPFKASDIPHAQDVPFEWLSRPFRLPDSIMRPEPDYFTYPFDKGKIDFFLINDKDTFFPPSTRNRIVSDGNSNLKQRSTRIYTCCSFSFCVCVRLSLLIYLFCFIQFIPKKSY